MKSSSFVSILKKIATDHKTVYAWGMFGSVVDEKSVAAKTKQYPDWYTERKISTVFTPIYRSGALVWGFDCVGLIKAVLWGWNGETSKSYGGAVYASNGVPDLSADGMIGICSQASTDMANISVGEFLWMKGHCGIYIGGGKVVESTPKWENGVQITDLSARSWQKHGKLPYVEYASQEAAEGVKFVTIELPMLSVGSKGNAVKTLQRLLHIYGRRGKDGNALSIDGDFGKNTDFALRSFQKSRGIAVDGICGKDSWSKLLK